LPLLGLLALIVLALWLISGNFWSGNFELSRFNLYCNRLQHVTELLGNNLIACLHPAEILS